MLLSKQYATRGPLRLALVTMLILLLFAWYFYQERTAFYDLSYHLFYYLKDKALFILRVLFIQNRRFVAIVTQLPTVLAIKAELPLNIVQQIYSTIFVFYYLIVFLLTAYWFRNEHVALVVVLLFVLLASRTFYWAQSELPQGLAALLLFYGGIGRQAPLQRRFSTLFSAALVPVFIFGHPLIILPFLFIWTYDWLLNKRFQDWGYYGMLVLALAMYKLRDLLTPPGSYEATHMTFQPNLIKYFPYYLSLESFDNFWHLCTKDFIALPILLLVLTIFYIRQRTTLAWLRLGLIWAAVTGYTFIINVSNPGYTEATYLENLYLPLTLFVAIPFALELLPSLEKTWNTKGPILVIGLLALTLSFRVGVIWYRHIPYTAYQQWLKHLLVYTQQFPERKYLMWPDNVDPYRLRAGWPWWSMATETMMVSARYSPDSVQTVRVGWDIDDMANAGTQPGLFLGPFERINTADLPSTYCRFPNTTYRVLNTQPPQDTAALRSYIEAHQQQVRLTLLDPAPAMLSAAQQHTMRILVSVDKDQRPLHSGIRGPHPTLLRASFYKTHDWPSDTDPTLTPLEVDVWQPWSQTIPLQTPHQPGKYILEISLISMNYRDWPVQIRVPIEIQN